MSKGSGWAAWRARYDRGQFRGRDVGTPGTKRRTIEKFVNESRGPLAVQLRQNLTYDFDKERIEIDKERVRRNAAELTEQTKSDAFYERRYQARLLQEQYKEREGVNLSEKAAERRYNREQAKRAEAILIASKAGRVSLTESQRRKLTLVSEGHYSDLVYSQYKAGDRGTGAGARDSGPLLRRERTEQSSHNRQEFRRQLAELRNKERAASANYDYAELRF